MDALLGCKLGRGEAIDHLLLCRCTFRRLPSSAQCSRISSLLHNNQAFASQMTEWLLQPGCSSRKALEARRRNRFRSALSAILRRSQHDPMHRWVTGRRCAGRQGGFAVWAAASLAPQLTWRRVAPRPCRGLPGQAELYRPGPTPVYFWRSAREWAKAAAALSSLPASR